jgi:preprotein translocase subunit Sec63
LAEKWTDINSIVSLLGEYALANFAYHIALYPNGIEILFQDITFTEEEIKKRCKEVYLIYHPDKTTKWKYDRHKRAGEELFILMEKRKNKLLKDIKKQSEFIDVIKSFTDRGLD